MTTGRASVLFLLDKRLLPKIYQVKENRTLLCGLSRNFLAPKHLESIEFQSITNDVGAFLSDPSEAVRRA